MDLCLADNAIYSSRSQLARIMSETWIEQNMYCPRCGNIFLQNKKIIHRFLISFVQIVKMNMS